MWSQYAVESINHDNIHRIRNITGYFCAVSNNTCKSIMGSFKIHYNPEFNPLLTFYQSFTKSWHVVTFKQKLKDSNKIFAFFFLLKTLAKVHGISCSAKNSPLFSSKRRHVRIRSYYLTSNQWKTWLTLCLLIGIGNNHNFVYGNNIFYLTNIKLSTYIIYQTFNFFQFYMWRHLPHAPLMLWDEWRDWGWLWLWLGQVRLGF